MRYLIIILIFLRFLCSCNKEKQKDTIITVDSLQVKNFENLIDEYIRYSHYRESDLSSELIKRHYQELRTRLLGANQDSSEQIRKAINQFCDRLIYATRKSACPLKKENLKSLFSVDPTNKYFILKEAAKITSTTILNYSEKPPHYCLANFESAYAILKENSGDSALIEVSLPNFNDPNFKYLNCDSVFHNGKLINKKVILRSDTNVAVVKFYNLKGGKYDIIGGLYLPFHSKIPFKCSFTKP